MLDSGLIHSTIDRSQHTVLVVDDNPATRYATARFVRAAGFRTAEAATGGEGIALSTQQMSAVVLDVHLPDLNGFEVCRAIRSNQDTTTLPVIHLSAAYVQDADRVAGLNAGADAYLIHPLEPAVLVGTLQALIRARMAEDQLRRSDTRFRAIYSLAQSGMALVRADGHFADVNPAMVKMLGRSRADLLSQSISELAPAEWRDFIHSATVTALEHGTPWQGSFPLIRPGGELVFLEWSISAHVEPGLRIAVVVDVSERHELERRRQEVLEREQAARAVAERQSRTKDDFVAVLSHELRTPLNAIAGWVHILKKQEPAPQTLRGLDAIDRSVKAQARIISDILDVSRINSGKLRLDREWIDAKEVLVTSLEALQSSIDARKLTVRISAMGSTSVWLDPTRFQQIFWNLMTNAIKFSHEGGLIEVHLGQGERQLTLSVRDFGRGVSPDFLPHLFSRFTQSDGPDNRHHGGLGLGLSIVKHLAELHGGNICAKSDGLGTGATLLVTLDTAPSTEDGPPSATADVSPEARTLRGLDILIVEDNFEASEMLTVVLADAGASVRLAVDFTTALAAVAYKWPDILVSDIGLPGRDGYELARAIRALEASGTSPKLPAIALTAFTRPQDREKSLGAGFNVHLTKPLQPHALIAAIRSLLQPKCGELRDARGDIN